MSEFRTGNSDDRTGNPEGSRMMPVAISPREEMQALLRSIAASAVPGESLKSVITRLARRFGWQPNRTEDLWRGEARPSVEEMDSARRAAGAKQEASARDELAELRAMVARLEGYLVSIDPDAASALGDPYRHAVRPVGGSARTAHRAMDRE